MNSRSLKIAPKPATLPVVPMHVGCNSIMKDCGGGIAWCPACRGIITMRPVDENGKALPIKVVKYVRGDELRQSLIRSLRKKRKLEKGCLGGAQQQLFLALKRQLGPGEFLACPSCLSLIRSAQEQNRHEKFCGLKALQICIENNQVENTERNVPCLELANDDRHVSCLGGAHLVVAKPVSFIEETSKAKRPYMGQF